MTHIWGGCSPRLDGYVFDNVLKMAASTLLNGQIFATALNWNNLHRGPSQCFVVVVFLLMPSRTLRRMNLCTANRDPSKSLPILVKYTLYNCINYVVCPRKKRRERLCLSVFSSSLSCCYSYQSGLISGDCNCTKRTKRATGRVQKMIDCGLVSIKILCIAN